MTLTDHDAISTPNKHALCYSVASPPNKDNQISIKGAEEF